METVKGWFEGDGNAEQFQLTTQSGLGLEDYLKYKSELDKARSDIKGEYDRSKNRVIRIQQDLLDKYEKLFAHVKETDERDKSRTNGRAWAPGSEVTRLFTDEEDRLYSNEAAQHEMNLLAQVGKLQEDYDAEEALLTKKSQNLSEILLNQGSVVATAEKAEAKDISLRRSKMRQEAHNAILEALRGDINEEGKHDSVSMQFGAPKSMRKKKDGNSSLSTDSWTAIQDVKKEFDRLAAQEEQTDQYVDRLRVKLDSINLLEESQVEMVDFQNRLRQSNLNKIKDIEGRVSRNNDEICMLTKQIQGSLSSKLENLVPTSLKSMITCTVCLIIVVCIALVVFFGVKIYSNGFNL